MIRFGGLSMSNPNQEFFTPTQAKRRAKSAAWIVFGVALALPIAVGIIGAYLISRR
jgi:hypothetical protein